MHDGILNVGAEGLKQGRIQGLNAQTPLFHYTSGAKCTGKRRCSTERRAAPKAGGPSRDRLASTVIVGPAPLKINGYDPKAERRKLSLCYLQVWRPDLEEAVDEKLRTHRNPA